MIFSACKETYNKNTESIIMANCDCGCNEEIQIKKFTDPEKEISDDYYIEFLTSKFYSEQDGIFKIIKHRLKRAWCSLRGKDYQYMEIYLSKKSFEEFKSKINKL